MNISFTEKNGKWFDGNGVRVWRAGTLVYYKKDLVKMFFWLYMGQFTFWMEHIAIPTLFPLLMARKGFDALQIGSLWSIFPLGALVIFPILGTLSDRTRTRFGRRRPFSFCMIPFWLLGLVLLPFTECYWAAFATMLLVGVAGAGSNVLNGFYNDVVPAELMGRFVAGMRLLGSVGGLIVQLFALRMFDRFPIAVFVSIACIGSIGELLMVCMVKEGEYPPPPPKASIFKTVGEFLKDGFANRYIIFLWLTMGVTALGGPVMATYFNLFFTDAKTGLGLSSTQLGYILAVGTGIGLFLIMPAGLIVDRVGPKKIWGWSGLFVGFFQIMMFFFARSVISVSILYAVYAAINTLMTATLLPMMYSFIPKDKFGQLNGANQILGRALQIIGANGCGLLIAAAGQQYRFAFIFGGIAYMLAPVFLILMLKQPWPYNELETSMNPDGLAGKKIKRVL